jgi:predicted nuclease of predicted toxin-antitoxin system
MKLYLDEDMASGLLRKLLQKAGHDAQSPSDVGLLGKWDPIQLKNSIKENRVFLSYNFADFEDLHLLIQQAKGVHSGILVIRREKDPRKNMSPVEIVRALKKLEKSGVVIVNQYIVLNHWK